MKYNSNNKPTKCYMKNSTCYKSTYKMDIKGILWHSTGANNPDIKRYVQPNNSNDNKAALLKLIGKNSNGNDWNHIYQEAGVNAFVGKLANGTVSTVQVMPWNYRPWGCASGPKGSCNNGWIQFEICEDGLSNKEYFNKVYKEAVELTAYLCKKYDLNPKGRVKYNGVSVPVILCHQDSYQLGLGSNHSDVLHWFKKHGKTMADVRDDVYQLIHASNTASTSIPKKGSSGKDVITIQNYLNYLGFDCGTVDGKFGEKTETALKKCQKWYGLEQTGTYNKQTKTTIETHIKNAYKVKITADSLNVRVGAGEKYKIISKVSKNKEVTIVRTAQNKTWGKISNNVGWIALKHTEKI